MAAICEEPRASRRVDQYLRDYVTAILFGAPVWMEVADGPPLPSACNALLHSQIMLRIDRDMAGKDHACSR